MREIRGSNPMTNPRSFAALASSDVQERMTVRGAIIKTAFLLMLLIASGVFTWTWAIMAGSVQSVSLLLWVGILGGFGMAMVTIFKKEWAMYTAPFYAVLEGFALGGLSLMLSGGYGWLPLQAAMFSIGVLVVMLVTYLMGWIKVTDRLRSMIIAATGAVALVYLATLVLQLFGLNVPFMYDKSWYGILFNLVVIGIAAFNLLLDFNVIETGAEVGAPKYMEWYGAFGLLVTLVWLYLEILRLLSRLNRR